MSAAKHTPRASGAYPDFDTVRAHRARFEKAAQDDGFGVEKDSRGVYTDRYVAWMWKAWLGGVYAERNEAARAAIAKTTGGSDEER